jgi:hypothetical protein
MIRFSRAQAPSSVLDLHQRGPSDFRTALIHQHLRPPCERKVPMIRKHANWAVVALVVALACGAAVASAPAGAQTPPVAHPHDRMDAMRDRMPGAHVEGHIAFLKAELAITDAQAPLWDKVAAAMREDVAQMRAAMAQASADGEAPPTALAYLERRARFAALRAEGEARFLAAFRPLYEALSPAQRKTADELLIHGRP